MRALTFARRAQQEERALLRHSRARFGPEALSRYALLLLAAYTDLCVDPDRPGVQRRDDLSKGLRLYHLRHSRTDVPASDRVAAPRHYIAFRADPDRISVARILHDSMNLPDHLSRYPPERG